jgi:nitrogen fixation NifU-like protein
MEEKLQQRIEDAVQDPRNVGEMSDADGVGTAGSADCGDMVRMWVKFKEEDGVKVIDRATFQGFGCQTAIAVASVATDLIIGKTADEALALSGSELSSSLGALPPMKIHCAQLVETALRSALVPKGDALVPDGSTPSGEEPAPAPAQSPTLFQQFTQSTPKKIVLD